MNATEFHKGLQRVAKACRHLHDVPVEEMLQHVDRVLAIPLIDRELSDRRGGHLELDRDILSAAKPLVEAARRMKRAVAKMNGPRKT